MKKLIMPILFVFALSTGLFAQSYDESFDAFKALVKAQAEAKDPTKAAEIAQILKNLETMPRAQQQQYMSQLGILRAVMLNDDMFPAEKKTASATASDLDKALIKAAMAAMEEQKAKGMTPICDHCGNPMSDKCDERGGMVPCPYPATITPVQNSDHEIKGHGFRALLPDNHNPEVTSDERCPECGVTANQAHRCKTSQIDHVKATKPIATTRATQPICTACGEPASNKCKNRGRGAPCVIYDKNGPTEQDLPKNHKQEKVERCPDCGVNPATQAHRCKTK